MPIYEYACQACGAESEILQKLSDPPERKCPACGKLKLVKQVSAAGFRLAGGGWYETDFKKDGKRNLAGDKAEAAADSKPDAGEKKAAEKKEPTKAEPKAKPDKKAEKASARKPAKAA